MGLIAGGQVDLARLGVVRAEVDVRSGDDVGDAVAIEVIGAGAEGVVEVAEPLHPEAARHAVRLAGAFSARSFHAMFSERARPPCRRRTTPPAPNRPMSSSATPLGPALLMNARMMFASSSVSKSFQSPGRSAVFGCAIGSVTAGPRTARRRGPATAAPAGAPPARPGTFATPPAAPQHRRTATPARRSAVAAARCAPARRRRAKPVALRLPPLRVEDDRVGGHVTFVEGHEDALHAAVGGLLGAQQNACLAAAGTSERRRRTPRPGMPRSRMSQPPAGCLGVPVISPFGRAPVGITERPPPGQSRPRESSSG